MPKSKTQRRRTRGVGGRNKKSRNHTRRRKNTRGGMIGFFGRSQQRVAPMAEPTPAPETSPVVRPIENDQIIYDFRGSRIYPIDEENENINEQEEIINSMHPRDPIRVFHERMQNRYKEHKRKMRQRKEQKENEKISEYGSIPIPHIP